jgi:hypothetical protein
MNNKKLQTSRELKDENLKFKCFFDYLLKRTANEERFESAEKRLFTKTSHHK